MYVCVSVCVVFHKGKHNLLHISVVLYGYVTCVSEVVAQLCDILYIED